MKFWALFTLLCAGAHSTSLTEQWQEYKAIHGKTYKSLLEDEKRFIIFQDQLRKIEEHNVRFANGEVLYSLGINQFTDLTDEEFKATLIPLPPMPTELNQEVYNDTRNSNNEPINWVEKGFVTSVKDQGTCGGCWAFSAAGAIEGQIAKNGGGLVDLSVQNLIDCCPGNMACFGGRMDNAFKYVMETGVFTDKEYPWQGREIYCRNQGGMKISGYVNVAKNEVALWNALSTVGPISVALDGDELRSYSGGIFGESSGCINRANHAVLLVGAGTENGTDYWLLKNSWGVKWGIDGYFKLERGKEACAIVTNNSYPKL